MKISIVTPSYNQGVFIEDTIKSVIRQTYSDYEYIVVDACSSDNTHTVIDRYKNVITRLIVENDDGQSDAINKGFRFATGEILAYINADDYYFTDTLDIVSRYFESHPDVDMIYGDCTFTSSKGQFIRYFSEISDFSEDRLFNYSDFIMQPAAFWRKDVFDKYGPFDASLHYGFDWDFWCKLAKNGCRIVRVPEILAANRVYGETKTLSGRTERLSELKKINNRYKTSCLPHAYHRYVLSDLTKRRSFNLSTFLIPVYVLLSYGNILHHLRHYQSKILYGHLPKLPYLQKTAWIKIPRLDFKSIEIRLRAPDAIKQHVIVFSNEKCAGEWTFQDGMVLIQEDIVIDGKDVDIRLEFRYEYPLHANKLIRRLFWFRPELIAAKVLSVTMS